MTQAPSHGGVLRHRLERGRDRGRIWVVGHRGAMGYCPENTLVSFARAAELGADWIELDVHLTRDGQLAVIHDELVDRTTDGQGLVGSFTMAELQALDAGRWFGPAFAGARVPSLADVLSWARACGAVLDIEIKNAPIFYPNIEEHVVKTLDQHAMSEQVIVSSFDHPAVARVKALDARIVTGVLFAARPVDPCALARAAHADVLLPHWAYVTPADVVEAHAAGLFVGAWATSDPKVVRSLAAANVDAVASNHPDIPRQVLAS
jgi:glycerophosphoryl diester phosphodiesterase